MEGKYGQLAESSKINEAIYDCFEFINEKEQLKFVNKFRKLPHNKNEVMHTFRELMFGAFLSSNGLVVENERKICGKTPDWSILDNAANLVGIVEQVSHHVDRKTEDHILAQRRMGKFVIGYFPNANDPENHRIYSSVQEKVSKYQGLIAEVQVPYVVAIFIDFLAVVEVQEVRDCLMSGEEPLFMLYPNLSGVYYFCEANRGTYYFEFIENPYGLRKITVPTGFWVKS